MKTNKSQIEMMGLVIIVILIILFLFFSIALKNPAQKKTLPAVYADEKLASDFLITFLETSTNAAGCENANFRDIAIDCVREKISGYNNYLCNGQRPCEFFNDTLKTIIEKTLEEWDYNYNLTFAYYFGDEKTTLTSFYNSSCTGLCEESAPGIQPISLYQVLPGEARMELHLYQ